MSGSTGPGAPGPTAEGPSRGAAGPVARRALLAAFPAAMFLLSMFWRFVPEPLSGPLGAFLSFTCHRMGSRCLHLAWGVTGLCARCTCFWLGMAAALASPVPAAAGTLRGATIGLAMLLPMALDGFLQYAGLYESTAAARIVTGVLGGAGTAVALRALLGPGRR